MGFLQKLFGARSGSAASLAIASTPHPEAIMGASDPAAASAHFAAAGAHANATIKCQDAGSQVAYIWEGLSFDLVRDEVNEAVRNDPGNPEYRYTRACLTTPFGPGKSGADDIRAMASEFPNYVETCGYLANPEHWRTPFAFPRWSSEETQISDVILPSNLEGVTTSVRDGCRRVVAFFRRIERSKIPNLAGQRCAIRLTCMETPFGPVAGAYCLIDTHPTQPYTSETMLNVGHIAGGEKDASTAAYWLVRLLAQQSYTYVVLAEPSGRVFFNRRVNFDEKTRQNIRTAAERVARIRPTSTLDAARWRQAQQHFMNTFSLDEVRF